MDNDSYHGRIINIQYREHNNTKNKIMNNIKQTIKKEIQLLLDLTYKANWKIEEYEKAGYKVKLGWTGTRLNNGSSVDFEIIEFSKDLIKTKGKTLSPLALQRILSKINKELDRLHKEEYIIELTGQRPNGEVKLYLKMVYFALYDTEYEQPYYKESCDKMMKKYKKTKK